jgi:glycosyltransferase involved in cell wall biosynthesis
MVEIQRRVPEARLLIAGTPRSSFSNLYPGLLQEMGIAEFVRFLGFVTESDLVNLYNLSRLLVMPSRYEGFGLPVLEAMACGCPVISSNTTSLCEVTGSAGIQLDPHDEKAWVEAITEVLSGEPLRKQLSAAGLERAGRFSWEAAAEATAAVYQRVMQ